MNVYTTDKIRNVAVLGHGGAGKTSLVEAMAYLTGLTTRLGNVADGTTISDYDKEEQKRKFSINTSMVPIIYGDIKINVLDAPGYFDFVGEAEEAVAAADAAIIVVNGKSVNDLEVGTQKAWDLCERYHLPRLFYISNMDYDHANYHAVVENLTDLYGSKVSPLNVPILENEKFTGYVNVVKQVAYKYTDKQNKKECPIPDALAADIEQYHETMMETVAESSEEFMDRYFGGDEFTDEEIAGAIRTEVREAALIPVTMGSSTNLQGVNILMDLLRDFVPSPADCKKAGVNTKNEEAFAADYDASKDKSAFIFKSIRSCAARYFMVSIRSVKITTRSSVALVQPYSGLLRSLKSS